MLALSRQNKTGLATSSQFLELEAAAKARSRTQPRRDPPVDINTEKLRSHPILALFFRITHPQYKASTGGHEDLPGLRHACAKTLFQDLRRRGRRFESSSGCRLRRAL